LRLSKELHNLTNLLRSHNDVTKAALELTGQGKLPTIDSIRQFLGTGSSSTIAPHLRTWKSKLGEAQLIANKEKLPEDFVALMKGLWERVLQEAQTQINLIQQHADKNLTENKQQVDNLIQENKHLQQQYNQLLQKEQQLINDKLALEQAIIQFQNEQAAFQAESKTFDQRVTDKQERVDELQRLNQQVQKNLDHYREASREQRLKEQSQYESQIKYLEQSTQQYLQENNYLKAQLQLIQEKIDQLQQDNQALKNEGHDIVDQLNNATSQLTITKANLAASLKSDAHWQEQYQDVLNKFNDRENSVSELQKQVALLSQQLSISENQLSDIRQQNKLLAHEKWRLGQETAHLMGQLKQIEAIT
jgi:chromosome segregation ATPase